MELFDHTNMTNKVNISMKLWSMRKRSFVNEKIDKIIIQSDDHKSKFSSSSNDHQIISNKL